MATYKVIQDIEAEDKLLGPLSLKQFIYAIIVVVCGFVAFKLATVAWYLTLPFIPPMIVFGMLAAPLGRDQPTEVWLLAKFRYFLKPRVRIWDQSGQLDLVTVTAPKTIDPSTFTDNLSQGEVKSRLKTLSNTLDTRGWAIKNVKGDTFDTAQFTTDRLLSITTVSPDQTNVTVKPDEDILDTQNNPVAQQLGEMISASTKTHRDSTIKKMQSIRENMAKMSKAKTSNQEESYWYMNHPDENNSQTGFSGFQNTSFSASTPGSAQFINVPKPKNTSKNPTQTQSSKNKLSTPTKTMTPASDPAILELAHNDDLNVATIARQADNGNQPSGEVSVSLH